MAKIIAFSWTVGQQHTVCELGQYGWSSSANIVAVSDGVTWKATLGRPPAAPIGLRPTNYSRKTLRAMPPEQRLLLMWARKALSGKAEGYSTQTDAAQVDTTQVFAFGTPPDCRVTFIGYARRKLSHSIDALVRVFTEAAELCNQKWGGWYPSNPEVEVHTTSRAMGLAFEPGRKRHRISLHLRLLTEYDLPSIRRVILHELCHHYRNERFPLSHDPHDRVFCEELQKVDVTLAEDAARANQSVARMCTMFYEQRDEDVVKVAQKRKRPNAVEPVWSPEAGTVLVSRLKNGQLRLRWTPNPGFAWTVKVESLNDVAMVKLVKRFAPTQLDRVAVRAENFPVEVPNLLALAEWLIRGYSRIMVQTILYFTDTVAVHTKAPA